MFHFTVSLIPEVESGIHCSFPCGSLDSPGFYSVSLTNFTHTIFFILILFAVQIGNNYDKNIHL